VLKSTFHHAGLTDLDLNVFKVVFPFKFIAMDLGFKYLGFYIKAGAQGLEDWSWLLKKFEKRINNWCYRWLSLGGRLTLLKAVLTSQSVYWLSMAVVPISILNLLRRMMYNFLWKRDSVSHHLHLCNWEKIYVPKSMGGWGILNIFDFSKALATTTLWRVLMGKGIWHKIIMDKYLGNINVSTWLRSNSFIQNGVSKIWSGLLKVTYLILHGISWNPGSGDLVALGKDRILGIGDSSYLSTPLQASLKERNLVTLAQARNPSNTTNLSDYWVKSNDLGLEDDLAIEWDSYRKNLIDVGVILQEGLDQVMWTGGDSPGNPSARNFYLSIISSKCLTSVERWRLSIWKWKFS
jgi:hypothetical protein